MKADRTTLAVPAAIAAGVLMVGALAFAAGAPGRARPSSADLPSITISETDLADPDEAAPADVTTSTPEPDPTTDEPEPDPAVTSHDSDDDREVVTPDVRDSDDDEADDDESPDDDHEDGESSERDDSHEDESDD